MEQTEIQSGANIRERKLALFGNLLGRGGTEKFLRNVAVGLVDLGWSVTVFIEDSPKFSSHIRFVEQDGYRLPICRYRRRGLREKNSAALPLYQVFDGDTFDVVLTASDGSFRYPFNSALGTRVIDTIHYLTGNWVPFGTVAVVHLSEWTREVWRNWIGPSAPTFVISHPLKPLQGNGSSEGRSENVSSKTIIGMHQRSDDEIFSEFPLMAYQRIENENTAFLMIGGSKFYSRQAQELGLKNFRQLDEVTDPGKLQEALSQIAIYAHGRRDGEVNSTSIAEAMSLGLPIVSHQIGTRHLGHVWQLADCGLVAKSVDEYSGYLLTLVENPKLRQLYGERARGMFEKNYNFEKVMLEFSTILENSCNSPKPLRNLRNRFIARARFVFWRLFSLVSKFWSRMSLFFRKKVMRIHAWTRDRTQK